MALEQSARRRTDRRLVFDEEERLVAGRQDRRSAGAGADQPGAGWYRGRNTVNVAPCAGALSTAMCPPLCSMIP